MFILCRKKIQATKEKREKNVYNHHLGNAGYAGLLYKRVSRIETWYSVHK